MAQFLQFPANQKVVQRLDLSRAEITSLIDDRKLNCHDKTVKVASKNCDKFITPTVRVSTSAAIIFVMLDLSCDHDAFNLLSIGRILLLKPFEHNYS
jgi:hypothetical protein